MTPEQKEILADVVIDPDAWDAHQRAHFIAKHGEKEGSRIADSNLAAKVDRHRQDYKEKSNRLGYKTRAEREHEQN